MQARREHSSFELEQKLKRSGHAEDEIAAAIADLQQRKWQCDQRFCDAFIRHRSSQGYGPLRIRQELNQKGVASHRIESGFKAAEVNWFEVCRDAFEKKFQSRGLALAPDFEHDFDPAQKESDNSANDRGDWAERQKLRAKQVRFLQYRGFSFEHISAVLD